MPTSRGLAHVLIAVGFVAASVAYGAYAIINTILDPDATAEMTADLLSAAPIRDDLTRDLAAELRSQLPNGVESREATSIATAALADPRFAEAFAAAVRSLHEQLLGAGSGPVVLDLGDVAAATRRAVREVDPALAAEIPDDAQFRVTLADGPVPRVGDAGRGVSAVCVVATLLALVLLVGATAAHPSPRDAFARIGRRLMGLGAGPLVVFIAVPWLIGSLTGDWGDVASPITASLGRRLIPSALLLALSGLLLSAGARFFASRRRAGTEGGPGIAAPQNRAG